MKRRIAQGDLGHLALDKYKKEFKIIGGFMSNQTQKESTRNLNKLQGEYLSSKLNHFWTIDITIIKNKYYWLFIVDLASRRIVYHDVKEQDYTSSEAVYCLSQALKKEYSVKPLKPVRFIHTDSAGIFVSKEWTEFLETNDILAISSNSKLYQNPRTQLHWLHWIHRISLM